jgi:hypothetical protein
VITFIHFVIFSEVALQGYYIRIFGRTNIFLPV